MRSAPIDVAVCIVQAPDGRVLMAERTARQLSAGYWELPGGKVDPGETPEQAAVRELAEETGLVAETVRPWIRYSHEFRLRRLRLHFFRIDRWSGSAHGREGQRVAWVDAAHPQVAPILPSIERVLIALGLPDLYAVSDSQRHGGPDRLLARLPQALHSGLRLIQVREPGMAPDQRVRFARRVAALAEPHGARVLLAGSALEARRAGLSGTHATAAELRRTTSRPPVKLWVVSCHDRTDLTLAEELGADAAVVSPVLTSAAHPEYRAIGWEGLRRLAASARLPVYAQGGVSGTSVPEARRAGAVGITTGDWCRGGSADTQA
jgi:8-oxo-dGTP diphosphatase